MTEDASATTAHVEDVVEGKTFEFRYALLHFYALYCNWIPLLEKPSVTAGPKHVRGVAQDNPDSPHISSAKCFRENS
jgi:hypothetical protein